MRHWNVHDDCLELASMPFYWRLSDAPAEVAGVRSRLPIRIARHPINDYLRFEPTADEWQALETAYRQDANIGFINPESGQMLTYGSSVNNFFLSVIRDRTPKDIFEIGCGAGFTVRFLSENGWEVTGIDPSEYSARWADRLGFRLINEFFQAGVIGHAADLIYCNDVFEHVRDVETFSRNVFDSLRLGGALCVATTNSQRSIEMGDISMLEHQHVNMFSTNSIYRILGSAGFSDIRISKGSYGNTFHIVALKGGEKAPLDGAAAESCERYFDRAKTNIEAFGRFYQESEEHCGCYVPLRCLPYLASVGDFGRSDVFDSNTAWRGKYIDGYTRPIRSLADVTYENGAKFFVGSLTFFEEIKQALVGRGYPPGDVFSIATIG